MSAIGEGADVGESAFQLARLVVAEAHAERAFVALVDDAAVITAAWGADIDGLSIGEAEQRFPLDEARAALRNAGPAYYRDLKTPLGNGARIVIAGGKGSPRPVIVAEHRFSAAFFDAIPSSVTERWAILGGVMARLWRERATAGEPHLDSAPAVTSAAGHPARARSDLNLVADSTTSIPLRASPRSFPAILGESKAITRALRQLDAAIDSDLPVLIVGETGTGKELFARALHEMGPRARAPFVAINCGAIPENLFEAEFFGHARGSFTGAERARRGLIGAAEHGTLLLDEVGELPTVRQASLLRALETKKFRGSGERQRATVRRSDRGCYASRLGEGDQTRGRFRRDLLFRLNVIEIRVPPLREREGDIEMLAHGFLRAAGSSARITPQALEVLRGYSWPGNVRELEHHMQRLATRALEEIGPQALPRELRSSRPRESAAERPMKLAPEQARREVERALSASGGNISHAAERLGVTRHGLKKRMVRLGMRKGAKA